MFKNIFKAIKAYIGAFKLINQLKLWKYFGVPILISFITAVCIGGVAWSLSDTIGSVISRIWIWDWGSYIFRNISNIIGGVVIIAIGLILYKHIIMALSAPFMSPVSEKIEQHLLGANDSRRETSFSAQLWRGIRINIRNLFMELLFTIPLLLLGFIPGVNIITSILLLLVQAYYAGFGNMDYTLERYYNYNYSLKFVRNHSGIAIGNGIIFVFMLFIPIVGIVLVLPLSVTAATKETLRLLEASKQEKLSGNRN